MNREKSDDNYIFYGEKGPGCFGLLFQGLIAVFKYFFRPNKLTINDARRLKDIHKKTSANFPIKSERVNKK